MAKKVTANGKTFTFDDNVNNDQIGTVVDEYFSSLKKKVDTNVVDNTSTNGQPLSNNVGIPDLNSLANGNRQAIPAPLTPQGQEGYNQQQNPINQQTQANVPNGKIDFNKVINSFKESNQKASQLYNEDPTLAAKREKSKNKIQNESEQAIIDKQNSDWEAKHGDSFLSKAGLIGLSKVSSLTKGLADIRNGIDHYTSKVGLDDATVNLYNKVFNAIGYKDGVEKTQAYLDNPNRYADDTENKNKLANLGLNPDYTGANTVDKAVNGFMRFVPQILASESTGGASFYFGAAGTASAEVDKLKKEGHVFKNGSDEFYIGGMGLASMLLMKNLPVSNLISKAPIAMRDGLAKDISLNALKTISNSGEAITAEGFTQAIKNEANAVSNTILKRGVNALKDLPKNYLHTARTLTGLTVADEALKHVSNKLGGEDNLQTSPEQMFDNITHILTVDAPLFSIPGLATGLFRGSEARNGVMESLKKDSSPENIQQVKQDIQQYGTEKGWSDNETHNSISSVDHIAEAVKSIPKTFSDKNFNTAVELITGRNDLKDQLSQIKESKQSLDESIRDIPTKEEDLVQAKLEQSNDKLQELATGDKYKYNEDLEKVNYTKQLGNGKPQEISKDRYELEQLEKQFKTQNNEKASNEKTSGKEASSENANEENVNVEDGKLQNGQGNGQEIQAERGQQSGNENGQNDVQRNEVAPIETNISSEKPADVSKESSGVGGGVKFKSKDELAKAFKDATGDAIEISKLKIAGISMRNGMRESGNENSSREDMPYNKEQLEMIDLYDSFSKKSPYLFHSTPNENINSIQKEGLVIGKKAKFEGISSPSKISLAANEDVAKYYGKDNDAILRVKKGKEFDDLESDLLAGGEGAYTTGKNIAPEDLEIKIKNKWIPVTEYKPEQSLPTQEVKTVKQLRAEEQAEYDAMAKPNDKAERQKIHDKYDKLITPLLEQAKQGGEKVNSTKDTNFENRLYSIEEIDNYEKEFNKEYDEITAKIDKELKSKGITSFEERVKEERKDPRIIENNRKASLLRNHNNELIKQKIEKGLKDIKFPKYFDYEPRQKQIENGIITTLRKRFLLDNTIFDLTKSLNGMLEGKGIEGIHKEIVKKFLPDGKTFRELSSDEQAKALKKTEPILNAVIESISKQFVETKNEQGTTVKETKETVQPIIKPTEGEKVIGKEDAKVVEPVKELTALETAKERMAKAKAIIDAKKNINRISVDSKQDAKDALEYHSAIVDVAKEYIKEKAKEGIKTLQDFADYLGEKVSKTIKDAWEEANGGNKLKEEDFLEQPKSKNQTSIDDAINKTIGISKAETEKQRAERGLVNINVQDTKTLKQMFEEGKNAKQSGEIDTRQLSAELSDKPRNLSSTEVNALLYDRQEIRAERDNLLEQQKQAIADDNVIEQEEITKRLNYLDRSLEQNEYAVKSGARENALALATMQNMISEDYSLSAQTTRMESKLGSKLTDTQKEELKNYSDQLDEANKKLNQFEKERSEKIAQEELKKQQLKNQRENRKSVSKDVLKSERKQIVDDFLNELKKIRVTASSAFIPYTRELVASVPFVKKMLVNLTKEGILEFKDVVNSIHDEFSKHIDGLKKDDIIDILAGKYNEKKETQNDLIKERNAIRRIAQLTTKLEDLLKGIIKEKSESRIINKRSQIIELEKQIKEIEKTLPPTPEQRNKVNLQNRLERINEKLKNNDFEKPERIKLNELDPETIALKGKIKKAQNNFNAMADRIDKSKESKINKALDTYSSLNRAFLLSGVSTLGKLYSFAAQRMITQPIEELLTSVNSKVFGLRKIAEQSPRYSSGFNPTAEAKAISARLSKLTLQDTKDVLKTGTGELDRLYGEKGVDRDFQLNPPAIEFFGRLHGAFKNSTKRAEFFRSFEKRMVDASKKGKDINDPNVQYMLALDAYVDSKRNILMNDNMLTDGYKSLLRTIESKGTWEGKSVATFFRTILPIVKIPTNYALEALDYSTFGVRAIPYILKAAIKGSESLTPKQSDMVMRTVAKGQFGLALMVIGYFNSTNIGGYYSGKRDDNDLKAGDVKIFGMTLPHFMTHNPVLEAMQIGATFRRAMDEANGGNSDSGIMGQLKVKDKHNISNLALNQVKGNETQKTEVTYNNKPYEVTVKNDKVINIIESTGFRKGLKTSITGLSEQVPFFDTPGQISSGLKSDNKLNKFEGDFLRNRIEPRLLQEVAEWQDRRDGEAVKRNPKTMGEYLKVGIPFVRQQVDEKKSDNKDFYKKLDDKTIEFLNTKKFDLKGVTWDKMKVNDLKMNIERLASKKERETWSDEYNSFMADYLSKKSEGMKGYTIEEFKDKMSQIKQYANSYAKFKATNEVGNMLEYSVDGITKEINETQQVAIRVLYNGYVSDDLPNLSTKAQDFSTDHQVPLTIATKIQMVNIRKNALEKAKNKVLKE